jgi:hypothetical protein
MELLASERPNEVAGFIDANAERLRSQSATFGQVAYQLSVTGDLERSERWFDGWERRGDVRPWVLWNRAIVQWRNGSQHGAEKTSQAALGLPYDDTINLHLTMLGLAALKRGDAGEAAQLQASVNASALEGWDRYLCDVLGEALWAIGTIEEGNLEGAKSIVESIVSQILSADPQAADRITRDLLYPVVWELLGRIGDRWFTLRTKAKLWYWRLG